MEFGNLKHTDANITSFRIVDVNSPGVDDAARDWEARLKETSKIQFNRQQLEVSKAMQNVGSSALKIAFLLYLVLYRWLHIRKALT